MKIDDRMVKLNSRVMTLLRLDRLARLKSLFLECKRSRTLCVVLPPSVFYSILLRSVICLLLSSPSLAFVHRAIAELFRVRRISTPLVITLHNA